MSRTYRGYGSRYASGIEHAPGRRNGHLTPSDPCHTRLRTALLRRSRPVLDGRRSWGSDEGVGARTRTPGSPHSPHLRRRSAPAGARVARGEPHPPSLGPMALGPLSRRGLPGRRGEARRLERPTARLRYLEDRGPRRRRGTFGGHPGRRVAHGVFHLPDLRPFVGRGSARQGDHPLERQQCDGF